MKHTIIKPNYCEKLTQLPRSFLTSKIIIDTLGKLSGDFFLLYIVTAHGKQRLQINHQKAAR